MSPVYYIYDENGILIDRRMNPYSAREGQEPRKDHGNPQLIIDLLPECKVFIARRMGDVSKRALMTNMGVTPIITQEEDPDSALRAFLGAKDDA